MSTADVWVDGWYVVGASMRGAAHARDGRSNQDAVGWLPADGGGRRVVAAVSDGHGGAPHFRSDRGSRIAVAQALELLTWHADEPGATIDALPDDVVAAWRAAVAADLAADPVAATAVAGARYAAYGATLIAVAADAHAVTLLQVGDGDLLLIGIDGTVHRPLADDFGLIGEQTYSLCLDDAERHFRMTRLEQAQEPAAVWPIAIVLASDGVSKSFRDDDAFADALAQLVRRAQADPAGFAETLPGWLDHLSHHGSGDDATLCLALRRPQPITTSGDRR